MASGEGGRVATFIAVSTSTRHIFQLLRCINFAPKAHVHITEFGLRFTAEESKVMQGHAFLNKDLFASYNFIGGNTEGEDDDDETTSSFQISLPSLLETLQIFGINDFKDRWSDRDPNYGGISGSAAHNGSAAFDNRVLGMNGMCRLSYTGVGEPLCITLEETGVTTTCELFTYEPEAEADIPLQKDISYKIIMRANWLLDAISELSSTSPTQLTIIVSESAPYFTLSSTGPLGSATVEFSKDRELLETFQVQKRFVNTYKYSLVTGANRAMRMASKVSIRGDDQGILNMQFLIDIEGGGVSYVDFRFVALLAEEGEADDDGGDEE